MNTVLISIACGVAGYMIGSIPFGYIIVYLVKGIDIRNQGSGRTGGTNVFRVAGFPAGLFTALLDVGKGAVTVLIIRRYLPDSQGWAEALAGIGVVLGHNASVFLNFRGGAGGATSVGTALALWPLGGLPSLVIGLFTLFVIGYASLATILSALAVAVVFTWFGLTSHQVPLTYATFGWSIVVLVVIALRPNIIRLLSGTEKRVSVFKRGG
ncbi:MAG: glycerol-3-phosphate 1-O-acyltransferase PlsY [Chloroflexi bacterium]|nr:glycerol-3-phosphate 1-O-acyltransferase PlsY [Chloroflexota bacterium]